MKEKQLSYENGLKNHKNFDLRNIEKKQIEFFGKKGNIRNGEFYRYYDGINIGNEISKDGKFMRLGIVLQNHMGNGLVLIAPLTTKYNKSLDKYLIHVNNREKMGLGKECWVLVNQIKLIDKKRFVISKTKSKANREFVSYIKKYFYKIIQ